MAIVVPTSLGSRVHIVDPRLWSLSPGTDFWLMATNNVAAAGTFPDDLADFEWTTTSLGLTAGSGADFMSSADKGAPRTFLTNAASDLLDSPAIFGDYSHAFAASKFLGYFPTKLCAEFICAFSVASADEKATVIGFIEDGGSPITADGADVLIGVYSDAVNFRTIGDGTAAGTGAAVDNAYHVWKIVNEGITSTVTMDGASTGANVIPISDEYPVSFGWGVVAAGTNRIQVNQVHVWYE